MFGRNRENFSGCFHRHFWRKLCLPRRYPFRHNFSLLYSLLQNKKAPLL